MARPTRFGPANFGSGGRPQASVDSKRDGRSNAGWNDRARTEHWARLVRMNGLPSPVSSFIGRDLDLVALAGLLNTGRLVTVTGPGGSGKTRLAIELAANQSDDDAGFVFVDLAPITDPDLILATIATALGVGEPVEGDLSETLPEQFGHRRIRLILDNLEQLPAAAPIIARLMTRWPTLIVLATSRAALHVQGEQLYRLGSMALPRDEDLGSLGRLEQVDAVRLFVERARSMDPRFAFTDENARAISEICVRLDGLPLAIELAAARTRSRSPASLLVQLQPLLPLLSDGPLDVPLRQQTVRATIEWSVKLLGSLEQQFFAALGVFVGGFTLAACEAVVADGRRTHGAPTPMSMLERMVDHSLVTVRPGPDGEPRFGLLETIREFALDRLSPARTKVVRDRHLAYFLAMAEDADRSTRAAEQIPRMRQLVADQANVRAALAWACETESNEALTRLAAALDDLFWFAAGGLKEGLRWFESALQVVSLSTPGMRVKLLQRAGWLAREIGLHDRATAMFEGSRLAATEGSDEAGVAQAMYYFAHRSLDAEAPDLDLAASQLEEAYERAIHAGAARLMGQIRVDQGEIARRRGDAIVARTSYEDALGLARDTDDTWATAYVLLQLGGLDRSNGNARLAIASLTESIRLSGQVGDKALLHWAIFSRCTDAARGWRPGGSAGSVPRRSARPGRAAWQQPGMHSRARRGFRVACRRRTCDCCGRELGGGRTRSTGPDASPTCL